MRSLVTGISIVALSLIGTVASVRAGEINVTNDLTRRYGELQLVVNPKNPDNILMASVSLGFTYACVNEKRPDCDLEKGVWTGGPPLTMPHGMYATEGFDRVVAFVSKDRGKTWKHVELPAMTPGHPDLKGRGDPSATVTPDGTFYFSYDNLNWGTPEKSVVDAGVAVIKSTDGGLTWSAPVLSGVPVDGPKISADPNTGTIYVAGSSVLGPLSTGNPDAPRGQIHTRWIASSKDGVTWTKPQAMGGNGSMSSAHGVLAAVFKTAGEDVNFTDKNNALCGDATPPCVVFETSTNAGATWKRHLLPVPADANRPWVAADPSKAGHFAVVVPVAGDKDILVLQTKDSGATWSKPVSVAEDTAKTHFHAWVAYSPAGVLGLVWRTRQPAADQDRGTPAPYNVWAAVSQDGGGTFSKPMKFGGADSPAAQGGLFGGSGDDYSAIALDADNIYIGWADWRPGERQNFFQSAKIADFKP